MSSRSAPGLSLSVILGALAVTVVASLFGRKGKAA
jgi:hypothetical protein